MDLVSVIIRDGWFEWANPNLYNKDEKMIVYLGICDPFFIPRS